MNPENKELESVDAKTKKGKSRTPFAVLNALAVGAVMSLMTVNPASAAIDNTTFDPIVDLIDAVIPLFTSILDLIIAVFPLVIAMTFLGGLALLITKIFDGTLNFGAFKKR